MHHINFAPDISSAPCFIFSNLVHIAQLESFLGATMQFPHLGIGMTWSSINLVLDFYNPAVELLWNTLKARGLHMKKSFKKAICDIRLYTKSMIELEKSTFHKSFAVSHSCIPRSGTISLWWLSLSIKLRDTAPHTQNKHVLCSISKLSTPTWKTICTSYCKLSKELKYGIGIL